MTFVVWSEELARATAWASQHGPAEACGVFLGHRGGSARWWHLRNAAPHPEHRFIFDRDDYIDLLETVERTGEEVWAIVHSHPSGPSQPSAIDIDAHLDPNVLMMIIDLSQRVPNDLALHTGVGVWRLRPGNEVQHETLVVLDGRRPETNQGSVARGGTDRILSTGAGGGGAIHSGWYATTAHYDPTAIRTGADGATENGVGSSVSTTGSASVGKDAAADGEH